VSWNIIYTKPKNEVRVAERLEKMGLQVYCPTRKEVRQWSDRKKKVTVPLFTSYVFVKITAKERNIVFEAPGVISYLFWLGKHAVAKDAEIEVIKIWNEDKNTTALWTEQLTPGDRVFIASGAFQSQEAILKEMGKNQLKLLLPHLGFSVIVTTKTQLHKVTDKVLV
jgi:transcription antitermination factor NusG